MSVYVQLRVDITGWLRCSRALRFLQNDKIRKWFVSNSNQSNQIFVKRSDPVVIAKKLNSEGFQMNRITEKLHPTTKILTLMWWGLNKNCLFKLDFSIKSLSVIVICKRWKQNLTGGSAVCNTNWFPITPERIASASSKISLVWKSEHEIYSTTKFSLEWITRNQGLKRAENSWLKRTCPDLEVATPSVA